MIPMNDHQVLAAVVIVLVLAMALWFSLRGLRKTEDLERRQALLEAELGALRAALDQAATASDELTAEAGRRHAALAAELTKIAEQQEQLRLMEEGSGGYSHAIRLAQGGASAEELARDCGLNRGEAELLVSLHGRPDND